MGNVGVCCANVDGNCDMTESSNNPGILLEGLTWEEAETVLTSKRVVVIPLGAQCKEHGLHLKLNNDWLIAEYLKQRVEQKLPVVIAPTINYSFYPAMIDYPGSVSLRSETARDLVIDICSSLARFGPRQFYVLNTGISTIRPLSAAREHLAKEGVTLSYTDARKIHGDKLAPLLEQEGGTHADEAETSMMLYIAPHTVDMSKAVKDYSGDGDGPLSRTVGSNVVYSPTGAWGDPTLATLEKGEVIVEGLVAGIMDDIINLIEGVEHE